MTMKPTRRTFLRMTGLSAAGLSLAQALPLGGFAAAAAQGKAGAPAAPGYVPVRIASWWTTVDDLLWPEKPVLEKIKRRADGFAKAGIGAAINFGFHNRFDFSNYFHQLHGFYAAVCDALHERGISFIEHYSCNHMTRPRNEEDFRRVHTFERHSVLLFPDPIAAKFAQYEGHFFNDLCEVDLRDGSRGYAKQYQFEAFCHNNPGFRDMHRKYLERLLREVPFDAIEVDDMCSYPGNTTCGCSYCRERFRKDYGHEIPDFSDKSFFGDTSKDMLEWGNYENPAYRDWLRMKADSVYDHVKMIKSTIGGKPLMTCCSDTGPIVLNAVALNLEKMAPQLDLFMLENVGTNIRNAAWPDMEAEALHQKDIAAKRNHAPAMALSYSLSEKGAYLGWALARFWGVANWSSTLNGRLENDPKNALEAEEAIGPSNNWEIAQSNFNYRDGADHVEVRLVNNGLCRENGWRDGKGNEHWDRSKAWTRAFLTADTGYRFVRAEELADEAALRAERTPLVLDGVACVSDKQFQAISGFLASGGKAWMAAPFGTHDEKGFARPAPLSEKLLRAHGKNIVQIDSALYGKPLEQLIASGKFRPAFRRQKGDARWAARLRDFGGKPTIHLMNAGLEAVPDSINDLSGIPLMKDLVSPITDNAMVYQLPLAAAAKDWVLCSPELGTAKKPVAVRKVDARTAELSVDLSGIAIYAVIQPFS